jgi:MFS family permease
MLPNILSFWVVAIIPEIMLHNLGVTNKEALSYYCGNYMSMFFWGIMVGSFLWPTIVNYLSKRNSVLVGIIGLGFFNYLIGQTTSLNMIFFYRFMCGIFHNLNSVGKDFIFDFAKPTFRLWAFSIKTLFTFVATFIGPWLGYKLYVWCNRDFALSIFYITLAFVVGVILFVVVYYVDFTPGDADEDETPKEHRDEEKQKLIEGASAKSDEIGQRGLLEVFKIVLKSQNLRSLIIIYFVTNGVYKAGNMIAILFMETPYADGGFGVTSDVISFISLLAFIPAAILVLVSPKFVPSVISYKAFITFFVSTLIIAFTFFPLSRDLIAAEGNQKYVWVSYVLLGFLYASVPKLYSPFINYNLNKGVDKHSRTSLNAVTFILSSASAGFFTTFIAPLLGISMYNPTLSGYCWAKYVAFVVLDIFLIIALWFIRKID